MESAPATKGSSKAALYRPQFQVKSTLPAIDDFRLNNILKSLNEETSAVSSALLDVTNNYQQDLKREIRQTLTTEQKIQYKNINAIKSAHELHHQWQARKKRLFKAARSPSEGYRKATTIGDEVHKLHVEAHAASSSLKNLALRLSEVDKKRGGRGVPDPTKYPKLAKIFAKLQPTESSASHSKGSTTSIHSKSTHLQTHSHSQRQSSLTSVSKSSSSQILDATNGGSTLQSDTQKTTLKDDSEESDSRSSSIEDEAEVQLQDLSDSDMDPEAFEMIMDMNIAKYRQKIESKHIVEQGQTVEKLPRNPIKLLATSALDVNSELGSIIDTPDTFKSLFLPIKSNATVVESPQLSLHKKLRINALPSSQNEHRTLETDPVVVAESLGSILEPPGEEAIADSSSDFDSSDSSSASASPALQPDHNLDDYPRHEPSHRVLKPKQSILKLHREKSGLRKKVSADHLGPKSPLEAFAVYRASPKSSFINEFSAMGVILTSKRDEDGQDNSSSEVYEDVHDIDEDRDSESREAEEEQSSENYNAVSKLRKLLI